MTAQFDYIIVGAGSAGCVLANRLSANPNNRVLLLEAGGSDRTIWIQMPLGYGRTFYDPTVNWMYQTQAEPNLAGRSCYWPRGKVLGGSSSINAMVYIRGLPSDFDGWKKAGNSSWGWQDVLPYFKKSEDHPLGHDDNPYHQQGGELHIDNMSDKVHPLCQHFIQSANTCGYNSTDDFNGAQMEGVGIYPINTHNGWRASSANAFLRPAIKRPNLTVITQAHASRILFSSATSDASPKALGVEYLHKGQMQQAHAAKEVILSGGAVNSPQLLQLSGIGDADLLKQYDIPVIVDNKAVGGYMQDHLALTHYYKSLQPTLNNELYPLLGKLKVGLQYVFGRKGLLSMSVNQAGGFIRSSEQEAEPNLQLYFNPLTYTLKPNDTKLMNPDPYAAFSMSFNACRPTSRGHLAIASPDPFVAPHIHPNYLSTDKDISEALAGSHILRKLANSEPIKSVISEEYVPGLAVNTDEAFIDDMRQRAGTIYHAVGTCRMGNAIATSVVDEDLRVHGVSGLRVIDASIFPSITSGNTNAPTIMVAEKGADKLLNNL